MPHEATQNAAPTPGESIADTARRLTASLQQPEPEPKRKGGRPKNPERVQLEQANAARESRINVLGFAFTATIGSMVKVWRMEPAFEPAQGRVLAEAWDPVILQYMQAAGPWSQALLTTAVVMSPYIMQGTARIAAKRATQTRAKAQAKRARPEPEFNAAQFDVDNAAEG